VSTDGPTGSVAFAATIALKPRSASAARADVQANLARTIRSVVAATAGTATIVVACHEIPEADQDAVHVVPVDFPEPRDRLEGIRDSPEQRGHQEYDLVAIEFGRPPAPVPFFAALYLVNHAESLWAAKRGDARRSPGTPRDVVPPAAARRILAEDFAAPDLASRVAGAPRTALSQPCPRPVTCCEHVPQGLSAASDPRAPYG
jgi:hypothetical protein